MTTGHGDSPARVALDAVRDCADTMDAQAAGLHERQHELHAYCCRCGRWRVLDLEWMVDDDRGESLNEPAWPVAPLG
jgi:hypothetical protein